MLNLVDRYSTDATSNDDGVVALEYVVVAGLVTTGIAVVFGVALWTDMRDTLASLF